MSKNSDSRFIKGLKKLFSKKLFLFSLSLYILIPIFGVLIVRADNEYRTAGTYVCYENGKEAAKIVLNRDNSIIIENYNENAKNDSEFVYKERIVSWGYRVSSWNENFDPDEYPFLSREYILLEGKSKNTYVAFFKIGKNIYSSYLLPSERGGGQKCYTKI